MTFQEAFRLREMKADRHRIIAAFSIAPNVNSRVNRKGGDRACLRRGSAGGSREGRLFSDGDIGLIGKGRINARL